MRYMNSLTLTSKSLNINFQTFNPNFLQSSFCYKSVMTLIYYSYHSLTLLMDRKYLTFPNFVLFFLIKKRLRFQHMNVRILKIFPNFTISPKIIPDFFFENFLLEILGNLEKLENYIFSEKALVRIPKKG